MTKKNSQRSRRLSTRGVQVSCFAFPNHGDMKPGPSQGTSLRDVSLTVGSNFVDPEFPVPFRYGCLRTAGVPVPKAAVYEYRPSLRLVREVRRAGQTAAIAPVS